MADFGATFDDCFFDQSGMVKVSIMRAAKNL